MGKIEYDSNNSGGHWWLKDEHWVALEKAGWVVDWFSTQDHPFRSSREDGRWLGGLASRACKEGFASMREGVEEWERLTGQSSTEAGCPCCGQPHNFEFTDDDGKSSFGPSISYEARWD